MPKVEKIYKVRKSRSGRSGEDRETIVEGTLEYLKEYFSYTLEVGHSWNNKINKNPTTIKSFISNLKKSFEEKEAACYNRTYIELVE